MTTEVRPLGITLERARELYPTSPIEFKKLLEDNFGKVLLMPDIMDRIQDFDDILRECGVDKAKFERLNSELEPDEVAYRQKRLITKAYNQGWFPDWKDASELKHRPYWDMSSGFSLDGSYDTGTYSIVGARLCFRYEKHCIDAAKKFKFIDQVLMTQ